MDERFDSAGYFDARFTDGIARLKRRRHGAGRARRDTDPGRLVSAGSDRHRRTSRSGCCAASRPTCSRASASTTIRNGLLDDDGDIYRRGGTVYGTDAVSAPLTWLWSGVINERDVLVTATAADLNVYMTLTAAPVVIAGAGLPRPVQAVVFSEALYLPNLKTLGIVAGAPVAGAWVPPAGLPSRAPSSGDDCRAPDRRGRQSDRVLEPDSACVQLGLHRRRLPRAAGRRLRRRARRDPGHAAGLHKLWAVGRHEHGL